ncbi:MAG: LptF/LptG family permease [Bacteroidia bacterium]|nr:LptF/LptG family permease [Bacteroidia bacterium]
MKKIDKLVLMDFVPPYLLAFFVAEFVLVMQFLWKYIDVIIGKGVSLGILLELIFYWSVRIIPESLPVSILIAAVMVFGNLGEKYELSSMKSAGISLTRIMGMGILIAILTTMFSLFASNYLKPRANYKFIYRYNAIKRQKPALSIEEGIFNTDFKNVVIRVGQKGKDGQSIGDILVYDHAVEDKRDINMLLARKGRMYAQENEDFFIMELEDGEQYRELKQNNSKTSKKVKPMIRTKFDSWTKIFDLSEFDLEAQNVNLTRKKYDLLNSYQLLQAVDSFNREIAENKYQNLNNFSDILQFDVYEAIDKADNEKSSLPKHVKEAIKSKDKIVKANSKPVKRLNRAPAQFPEDSLAGMHTIASSFKPHSLKTILTSVKHLSQRNQDKIVKSDRMKDTLKHSRALYVLRLHQQHSWAFICIIFLFIGASLGSIVKKGGYGYPLLIAIVFFMLFIIFNIMGEKLTKGGTMEPVLGAWLPYFFMLPIAVLLTFKALNDSDFSWLSTKINLVRHRFFPDKE